MNELQVIINEEPGSLTWNFEELKQEIGEQLAVYETIVYTDANIVEAKKDVADLRKLEKAVEDRRKEIKKRWMAPYELLEKQAKELVKLIEEPINTINSKVSQYELEERHKKEELVENYFKQAMEGLPGCVQDALLKKKWDDRWGLKSVTKKTWTEAIDGIVGSARTALTVIDGMDEDFREPCFNVYLNTLDLGQVIAKQTELADQKKRLLEAEQRRQAQEAERRERERREQERREQEAQAAQRHESTQNGPETVQEAQARSASAPAETFPQKEEKPAESDLTLLRVKANEMQLAKITGYIKFVGAEYEVLG